jgi:hypothetical protein
VDSLELWVDSTADVDEAKGTVSAVTEDEREEEEETEEAEESPNIRESAIDALDDEEEDKKVADEEDTEATEEGIANTGTGGRVGCVRGTGGGATGVGME